MIVFGEGPTPARVMGIGEAPGEREHLLGRPFVGRTGEAMNRYWGRGGVPLREDLYLTNVIKHWPGKGNRDPLDAEIDYWLPSLCGEIEAVRPSTILTLGRFALRLFLDLDMESAHAIPFDIPLAQIRRPDLRAALRHGRWPVADHVRIFPSYHPAFALHDPTMQSLLTYDFERLGQSLRGLLPARHIDHDARGYYDVTTSTPSTLYSPRLALDTEGWRHAIWGLSYSDRPGSGTVLRAADAPKFKTFLERHAADPDLVIYLHHALHDLPILRALGIDLHAMGFEVRDTMVMAYLLGLEPQGLKALGWRHCGVKMRDYTDLTAVSDERIAREWLITLCASLPEPVERPPKTRVINLSRRTRDYAVKIDRSTKWGNQFRVEQYGREQCIAKYADWIQTQPGLLAALPELRGKVLACHCKPLACHGDVLARLADALPLADPITVDLMRARTLAERMLLKGDGAKPLRTRWQTKKCAARVILEDELALVGEMPLPTLDDVIEDHGGDETQVIDYAGCDVDVTRRVGPILEAQIDAYGLRECFEVTNGIIPMIDRMQSVGIKTNPDHFRALLPIFDGLAADLDAQITHRTGRTLNANSGDQVADLLFDRLRLHKRPEARHIKFKRTDTGRYSTDDNALEAIEDLDEIVTLIRRRRELTKLKGSYVLPILDLHDPDDCRLRCELLLTRTDTGRLAAKHPNLLAWPKHSELGMLIRHGFVADEGHEFGAWDMDQIEMRVFAHDADEYMMLLAFAAGKDLHADTAALLFGRRYDDIMGEYTSKTGHGGEQRFEAKKINFGILMGVTAYGLVKQFHRAGQLHITLTFCEDLLAEWRRVYKNGAAYVQSKHEEARRFSYVRDMFGRLRWLDGVHSEDDYIRAEAERMAQSTPTQSGAQGIMQRAMRDMWPDLCEARRSFWVEPLLQTHDELLFEYDRRHRATMDRIVLGHMARAVTLKVPITAKGAYGQTWGDLA